MSTRKPPSTQGEVFYTRAEVAAQLGVSIFTISRLVARGELAAVRVGQQLRFPQSAVDAYVARASVTV
jgi:excisionase family DNA binding protein